jgi:hypothetical protein
MVSRKQSLLISLALIAAAAASGGESDPKKSAAATSPPVAAKRKFLSDDPLWKEPKPRAVKGMKAIEIDDLYDFLEESLVVPRRQKPLEKNGRSVALNVNTLGEVPDSEWYTNRHARRQMTLEQLVRGPGNADPPDPSGKWRIVSAKSDGVMPGFAVEDARGNRYLLKFDPPNYPELASAPDVIGSKFYYALGFNTPENYIAYFRRDQLVVPESSSWRDKDGKKHLLTSEIVDKWLAGQPKDSQGRYRIMASRWVPGKAVGPFEFEGTRSDDPNDVVPHQNRRELRGMAVLASWLNDTDAKAINTLDSLVEEDGISYLKHFRIDWGASLGSDSLTPKDIRRGHDYALDPKSAAFQAYTFGFYLPKWMRVSYPSIRGVGTFDYESFDALHWRSNYPVTTFLLMDDEDAFWAAKQVMSFSDKEIRAIVETGKYSDPRATDWVTECLVKRRDKIGKAWLSRGLALDNFRIEQGRLVFDDLAEKYNVGPKRAYKVEWSAFENSTGDKRPVESDGNSWTVPSAAGARTGFLSAAISLSAAQAGGAAGGAAGGEGEVTVYLRQSANGWDAVGIDRRYK